MEKLRHYAITRSYAKKIQFVQYQPEDFSSFHEYVFFEMPTKKQIEEKSKELFDLCVKDVVDAITERERSIQAAKEQGPDLPY